MRFPWLVALFAITLALPASAQEAKQDFTLVNRTGYELSKLFVSPSKEDDWGEDVLGQDTMDDGTSLRIRFHRSARTCRWDLKVVYSVDDSDAVWRNIDLCSVSRITLHYNKNTDKTTASFD